MAQRWEFVRCRHASPAALSKAKLGPRSKARATQHRPMQREQSPRKDASVIEITGWEEAKNKNAVPCGTAFYVSISKERSDVLGRPGSDLLSQALRLSTIGAKRFNGRV